MQLPPPLKGVEMLLAGLRNGWFIELYVDFGMM